MVLQAKHSSPFCMHCLNSFNALLFSLQVGQQSLKSLLADRAGKDDKTSWNSELDGKESGGILKLDYLSKCNRKAVAMADIDEHPFVVISQYIIIHLGSYGRIGVGQIKKRLAQRWLWVEFMEMHDRQLNQWKINKRNDSLQSSGNHFAKKGVGDVTEPLLLPALFKGSRL
ncbi:hypothetical protein DFH29DRAFT_883755 [Suillus ampliporus]|nr:hypothetical protein DFH29DRAFT_883755 [Suillus ampliporus]